MERSFFDWILLYIDKYGELFLQGTGITLLLAVVGTVAGGVIGLLVAIVREIHIEKNDILLKKIVVRVARVILGIYIEVFRATPMIVQGMVVFYGLAFGGIHLSPLAAGLGVISINTGAYISEIMRGGIISVDKGQTEGALSIGMTHWQTMLSIVLPQAIRNSLPAIGNEFIINIKDSAVLSVIGVAELFFQSKSAAGTYLQYFPAMVITCVIYLILTVIISRVLRYIEKRMDGPKNYKVDEKSELEYVLLH
ncbi:MAG: amino acid ABC transporter permease [Clostridiales Family XIII bacterium]|jgi:putative lysine transport system permease protein|nr:amino acid ABC transporter permease [Clostridiales Family XIII bacterium]